MNFGRFFPFVSIFTDFFLTNLLTIFLQFFGIFGHSFPVFRNFLGHFLCLLIFNFGGFLPLVPIFGNYFPFFSRKFTNYFFAILLANLGHFLVHFLLFFACFSQFYWPCFRQFWQIFPHLFQFFTIF